MTQKTFEKLNKIDNNLDELKKDMEEIWCLINEMKSNLPKAHIVPSFRIPVKKKTKVVIVDDRTIWRRNMYEQIKILINKKSSFGKRSEVLRYIYNYMRKNYGIVWEQDIKEYKEHFGIEYKPKTLDVLYENKMYRSIFEAILSDMIANTNVDVNPYHYSLMEM